MAQSQPPLETTPPSDVKSPSKLHPLPEQHRVPVAHPARVIGDQASSVADDRPSQARPLPELRGYVGHLSRRMLKSRSLRTFAIVAGIVAASVILVIAGPPSFSKTVIAKRFLFGLFLLGLAAFLGLVIRLPAFRGKRNFRLWAVLGAMALLIPGIALACVVIADLFSSHLQALFLLGLYAFFGLLIGLLAVRANRNFWLWGLLGFVALLVPPIMARVSLPVIAVVIPQLFSNEVIDARFLVHRFLFDLFLLDLATFFGLVIGLLALGKNRNFWLWGLFGAMVFPIAGIALACVSILCPMCHHPLTNKQWKERYCPQCGDFRHVRRNARKEQGERLNGVGKT